MNQFDITQVICVILGKGKNGKKKLSDFRLAEIATYLNLDKERIIESGKTWRKIWLLNTQSGFEFLCAIDANDVYELEYKYSALLSQEDFLSQLDEIIPTEIPSKKEELPIVLELDSILDKISLHGLESLHESEKQFLTKYNN